MILQTFKILVISLLLVVTKVISQSTEVNEDEVTKWDESQEDFTKPEMRFHETHYVAKGEEAEEHSDTEQAESFESHQQYTLKSETENENASISEFSQIEQNGSNDSSSAIEKNENFDTQNNSNETNSSPIFLQNELNTQAVESSQESESKSEEIQQQNISTSELDNENEFNKKMVKNQQNKSTLDYEKSRQQNISQSQIVDTQQSDLKSKTENQSDFSPIFLQNEQSTSEAKAVETSSKVKSQNWFSDINPLGQQNENHNISQLQNMENKQINSKSLTEKQSNFSSTFSQNDHTSESGAIESHLESFSLPDTQKNKSESKSSEIQQQNTSQITEAVQNQQHESKAEYDTKQQLNASLSQNVKTAQNDSKSDYEGIETEQSKIKQMPSKHKLRQNSASKSAHKKTDEVKKMISELENAIILETELEQLENNEESESPGIEFTNQPNIIVIMADDLGFNDVSYHGSDQILTPNIDVLAYQGKILQEYYTDAFGTAARSAFFTGKYASKLGTQSQSIQAFEDRGLSNKEKLLPTYLKELGYATHLVGKWGLGKSRDFYLPTSRGFNSFYGFLDSSVDYYTYDHIEHWNNSELCGIDLYHNLLPVENVKGHLTDVLTDHAIELIREHDKSKPLYLQLCHAAPHAGGGLVNLQPPAEEIEANSHITHSARRLYAGMVTHMDKSIGHIIAALAETYILQNTIIIFISDNGAAPVGLSKNFGTNLPLRGLKGTPWEGGVRSAAVLWHAELLSDTWDGLFHVTDWLPTLVAAAGGNVTTDIDGVNQWDAIRYGLPSNRKEILVTIDDLNGFAAIREGDYKFIIGNNINDDISNYYGKDLTEVKFDPPSYEASLLECETARVLKETLYRDLNMDTVYKKRNLSNLNKVDKIDDRNLCIPTLEKGCLFNIKLDPAETHDLWNTSTSLIKHLTLRLRTLWAEMKPRHKAIPDDRSNPLYHNYAWSPFLDDEEPMPEALTIPTDFPLKVTLMELQYLVDINLDAFKARVMDSIEKMGSSFVKSFGGLFNFN